MLPWRICSHTFCQKRSNRTYRREGIAGLVDKRSGGNRAKLTEEQIGELGARLRAYTPAQLFGPTADTADGQFWSVEDLARTVRQWYDVSDQSRSSYYRLFDRCDFSYQRPGKVHRARSEDKIAESEEQLEKKSSTSSKRLPRRFS